MLIYYFRNFGRVVWFCNYYYLYFVVYYRYVMVNFCIILLFYVYGCVVIIVEGIGMLCDGLYLVWVKIRIIFFDVLKNECLRFF